MLTSLTIALILNGLTLTLALGLLILILWHDSHRLTNRYFAWFLLTMMFWAAGSLLGRAAALAGLESVSNLSGEDSEIIKGGVRLLELGFTSSALALYLYVAVLSGNRSRIFQAIGLVGVAGILVFHLMLYVLDAPLEYAVTASGVLQYEFSRASTFLFTIINTMTFALAWQRFRKIQRASLLVGVMLFCVGQLVALFSLRLRTLGIAEDTGAMATLMMAFAIVQYQIIQPLTGKTRQIEVVRDVGLVITSRIELQNALQTIAAQAANLLRADASLIFLTVPIDNAPMLVLSALHNYPSVFEGERLGFHEGLAGKVATERRPILMKDYRREWKGVPDTAFALQGFGAVIGVPLIFDQDVVGVLLVICGVEGRLFEEEDVEILNLLSPQAAVAVVNGILFKQQRDLASQLEVAKNRLEAVLFSTNNPVIAVNKKLEVIFANQAASLLAAVPEMKNQHLFNLVPKGYLPQNLREMLKLIKGQHSYVYEVDIAGRTYLSHVTRMQQPEQGWVAVLNDVTSLKELERLQRQMIELTTHQLKNPIMGVLVHLDELEELGAESLNEDMRYDIEVIRTQMQRMSELIKGILNLQRVQNRAMHRESVEIPTLLQEVVNRLKPLALSKHLSLESEITQALPPIVGDKEYLSETISNLVDNAIKYTPPQGKIKVSASTDNGTVVVAVRDTGIGIPPEHQPHVFDQFYRVEAPGTELIGGTGIGLSLARAIVLQHHGKIWLESEPQQGTTFYVSLPAAS